MEWMEVVDVINGKTENFENCIYMWRNKVNQKLYVGQAKDFKTRTKGHKYEAFNEKSKSYDYPLNRAIRKYGIENFEICILEFNLNDCYEKDKKETEIGEKEDFYIKKYDTLAKNKKGYNEADGGRSGNKYAGKTKEEMEEISKKKSEAMKGKFIGENHHNYGKHFSEETKEKMSKARKGEKSHQCRKVICITNEEIFGYIKQAEEKYGIKHGNIIKCCKRKLKSAGVIDGKPAIWMYLEDYEKLSEEEVNKIKNEVPNRSKAVICITTGKIYESMQEASRQTGVKFQNISRCCYGKCKSAGKDKNGNKLIWKFLDEYLESK